MILIFDYFTLFIFFKSTVLIFRNTVILSYQKNKHSALLNTNVPTNYINLEHAKTFPNSEPLNFKVILQILCLKMQIQTQQIKKIYKFSDILTINMVEMIAI